MRVSRKRAALGLSLALCLTACGGPAGGLTRSDAKTYVDGLLRELYYGELTEGYAELVDITEEEARDAYEAGIETEANFFIQLYGVEYPDQAYYEAVEDLYREIYSHARFEVTDAAEMADGSFSVQVTVEPIDIVQLADTDWDKTITPFYKKYPQDVRDAMTQAEYEDLDAEYAQLVLDLYRDNLDEIGNMASRTVLVRVRLDDDGCYGLDEEDFSRLDELIIDYTDNVGVSA